MQEIQEDGSLEEMRSNTVGTTSQVMVGDTQTEEVRQVSYLTYITQQTCPDENHSQANSQAFLCEDLLPKKPLDCP